MPLRLTRSPILRTTAMPAELRCTYDEDDNGLDDDVEQQIADAFVPEFRFDAAEEWTRPGEPHATYNITVEDSEHEAFSHVLTLTIRYMFVWNKDGGFANDHAIGCQDEHAGDTQPMTETVTVTEGSAGWYAQVARLDGFVDHPAATPDGELEFNSEGHPVVYPTAGKHHFRVHAGEYIYNISGWGLNDCAENAWGNSDLNITPHPSHVPHGTFSHYQTVNRLMAQFMAVEAPDGSTSYQACPEQLTELPRCVDPATSFYVPCADEEQHVHYDRMKVVPKRWEECTDFPPLTTDSGGILRWVNACEWAEAKRTSNGGQVNIDQLSPAIHLMRYDLIDWGYPSEDETFLSTQFRSVGVSGVWLNSPNTKPDVDGDGLPRWVDKCPMGVVGFTLDRDHDGIGDPCDTAPDFRSVYVAGGNSSYPAVLETKFELALRGPWTAAERLGFLDTDGDGSPDGEDLCPTIHTWTFDNHNDWGERKNWQPLEEFPGNRENNRLGIMYRGDACDPYPVARPSIVPPAPPHSSSTTTCVIPHWESSGSNVLTVNQRAGVGLSANDPAAGDLAYHNLAPKNYWTNTFRCNCEVFEGTACLNDARSPCYRGPAAPSGSHSPNSWGKGWRALDRVGCSELDRDLFGYCGPFRMSVPVRGWQDGHLTGNVAPVKWSWLDEFTRDGTSPGGDRHFATGDFTFFPETGTGFDSVGAHWKSRGRYVLWTWAGVDNGSEFFEAPGPFAQLSMLPDPEVFDPKLVPADGPNASEKSRRLRAGYQDTPFGLVSSHNRFSTYTAGCNRFDPRYFVHVRWPEEIIRWPDQRIRTPIDMLFGANGPRLDQSYVLRGDLRQVHYVQLDDPSAPDWLSDSPGLTAPLTTQAHLPSSLGDNLPPDIPGGSSTLLPSLMRVQQQDRLAQWAILSPAGTNGNVAHYDVTRTGTMPHGVSDDARLITDELGGMVALMDPSAGRVMGYDPLLGQWLKAQLTDGVREALPGATVALIGENLVVVGDEPGEDGKAQSWVIQTLGGSTERVHMGLPARTGAKLILSTDRRALMLVGGRDSDENVHDDLWRALLPTAQGNWTPAQRVKPDSSSPSTTDGVGVALMASSDGELARAWEVRTEQDYGVITPKVRTPSGWFEQDSRGEPMVDTCPADDRRGGELCKITHAWWAAPGMKACASASLPGECQGTPGELISLEKWTSSGRVIDAIPDQGSVWVLGRRRLQQLGKNNAGHWAEGDHIALPARARALSVRAGIALVGTDEGVQLVHKRGSNLVVSDSLELCGRPLGIKSMTTDLWAVHTTLGISMVSTSGAGTPRVLSSSIVMPIPGHNGLVQGLPTQGAQMAFCRDLDSAFPEPVVRAIKKRAVLTPTSAQELLVSRGPFVVQLDMSKPEQPVAKGTVWLGASLRHLRTDPWGLRAYGVAKGRRNKRHSVIDLRGGVHLTGQHNIPKWVKRRDDGDLSVRRHGSRQVQIAEVTR